MKGGNRPMLLLLLSRSYGTRRVYRYVSFWCEFDARIRMEKTKMLWGALGMKFSKSHLRVCRSNSTHVTVRSWRLCECVWEKNEVHIFVWSQIVFLNFHRKVSFHFATNLEDCCKKRSIPRGISATISRIGCKCCKGLQTRRLSSAVKMMATTTKTTGSSCEQLTLLPK